MKNSSMKRTANPQVSDTISRELYTITVSFFRGYGNRDAGHPDTTAHIVDLQTSLLPDIPLIL